MSTSGTSLPFLVCFVAVIAAAVQSVQPLLEGRLSVRDVPTAGWVLWVCVAVPSLLQIPLPQVYEALHRDAHAVLDGHQWWRLATSVTVQDGGIVGTVSNLVLLALALTLCLPLWGPVPTVTAFVGAGVGLNILAVSFGATDGGGNSGATLPLLASLPPLALAVLGREHRWRAVASVLVVAGAATVLVAVDDAHGVAVCLGLVLGLAGMPLARRRWS